MTAAEINHTITEMITGALNHSEVISPGRVVIMRASLSDDHRYITADATIAVIGDDGLEERTERILLYLSPPMPVPADGTPRGTADNAAATILNVPVQQVTP